MQAGKLREEVTNGEDPAVRKKTAVIERIDQRSLGTLCDLVDLYVADLETDGKRSAGEVRRIKGRDIPPTLLSRPAHLVTKEDILDILTPIAQRGAPVHSDHVRAYLRAAFELGLNAESMTRWRGRTLKFGLHHNPVAAVQKTVKRKVSGNRTLSRSEIKILWHTDQLTPPMLLALKMLLTTGQRVEEVLHATWAEFDTSQMTWIIPGQRRKTRGRTSEAHIVPLTTFHLELLNEIKHETANNIYLFPATGGTAPRRYDALTNSVRKFVQSTGIESFSPRDIRRTFKTVAGSLGISLELRNRLQGHALTDVGSIFYDRHDYLAEKRTVMQAWIDGLSEIVRMKE